MKLLKVSPLKLVMLIVVFSFTLAGCGTSQQTPDEESGSPGDGSTEQSVVIGLDPYDFSRPPVYIAKKILENEGYDVKIEEASTGILWAALAAGDIDAFGDIWDPNISGQFIEQYEGQYETVGTMYEDAPVGVVVPAYMDDEIDSIEQLNDMKDTFGGKIYTIDPETGTDVTKNGG